MQIQANKREKKQNKCKPKLNANTSMTNQFRFSRLGKEHYVCKFSCQQLLLAKSKEKDKNKANSKPRSTFPEGIVKYKNLFCIYIVSIRNRLNWSHKKVQSTQMRSSIENLKKKTACQINKQVNLQPRALGWQGIMSWRGHTLTRQCLSMLD